MFQDSPDDFPHARRTNNFSLTALQHLPTDPGPIIHFPANTVRVQARPVGGVHFLQDWRSYRRVLVVSQLFSRRPYHRPCQAGHPLYLPRDLACPLGRPHRHLHIPALLTSLGSSPLPALNHPRRKTEGGLVAPETSQLSFRLIVPRIRGVAGPLGTRTVTAEVSYLLTRANGDRLTTEKGNAFRVGLLILAMSTMNSYPTIN